MTINRLILALAILILPIVVEAHPGRTASDGCHYCRTRCDYWGETWNARHCHGGYRSPTPTYAPTPKYVPTTPRCPANAKYNKSASLCECNVGYLPSLNGQSCAKVPDNSHKANNGTDVWLCNDGYKEIGNNCLLDCEVNSFMTQVSEVIDGDTFAFFCDNKREKVRIIGIDSPETVHPSKPVECFGKEAGAKLKQLIGDKYVTLVKNPAENRDVYGRLLRYVHYLGRDIGKQMIKEGYAHSYKKYPHPRLDDYNSDEKEAREKRTGLWGDVCNPQEEAPMVGAQPIVSSSAELEKIESVPVESIEDKPQINNDTDSSKGGFWRWLWSLFKNN